MEHILGRATSRGVCGNKSLPSFSRAWEEKLCSLSFTLMSQSMFQAGLEQWMSKHSSWISSTFKFATIANFQTPIEPDALRVRSNDFCVLTSSS